jgi:hypothetical protein
LEKASVKFESRREKKEKKKIIGVQLLFRRAYASDNQKENNATLPTP